MGEGEGEGEKEGLSPPPLYPLPPREGRICRKGVMHVIR